MEDIEKIFMNYAGFKLDKILKNYGVDWKIGESNGVDYYNALRKELLDLIKEIKGK
jgi:hypothetical protein